MTEETRAEEIRRRVADGDVVVVHRLHDQFEQEVIQAALEAEGIPYESRQSVEAPFNFLFGPRKGYGVLMTRSADAARARELIGELLMGETAAMAAAALEAEASISDMEAPVQPD